LGIKQFPSLTDEGKLLYLSDSTGTFIHGIEYSSEWYGDDLKSQGGWSLEMIDTRFPFYFKDNWKASESRNGGTPGKVNSVKENNPDISFYGIQNVFADDSANIHIRFSEPVFNFSDIFRSIKIGDISTSDYTQTDQLFCEYTVKTSESLRKSELYKLKIADRISDFAGNVMQRANLTLAFASRQSLEIFCLMKSFSIRCQAIPITWKCITVQIKLSMLHDYRLYLLMMPQVIDPE